MSQRSSALVRKQMSRARRLWALSSPEAPHQFRTRNDVAETRQTRSNSNEVAAKSANPTIILALITVWLQVRVLPSPPNKSVPYQILFQVTPLETPYLRQTLSRLGRTQTSAALPVRRGLPLSIVDSAGSSHETAGLEDLCAKRSGKGSWPDRLSRHDSDNHRAWFRPKDRPGWEPLQGPMAVGLRSPADFRRPSDRRCRSPRVFAIANCL